MLWDLYSEIARKAYRSWNTTVKMAHDRNVLCRQLSLPSIRQLILRKFVRYVQCLVSSANPVICQLANLAVKTTRSVTGKNVKNLIDEFQLDPLLVLNKKFFVAKTEIPHNGDESIELLDYLLYLRNNETEEEIISEFNDLIFTVCT